MKVVVIGGGILGVSTAWNLARMGASVTLIEAQGLAADTSATSFAWLNSGNKSPLAYHQLNVAGMEEHRSIAAELGFAPWIHQCGNLVWGIASRGTVHDEPDVPVHDETLAAKINRLRSWNYPVEWVNRRDVRETHRDIALPDDVDRAAWFPSEGYCDVPLLIAHLAHQAETLGVVIRLNTSAFSILLNGDRVEGVVTDSGEQILADIVVGCVGRWTDGLTALVGQAMPMAPTHGLLVSTSKVATSLRSLVHTPEVNLRPDGGSRLLLAAYDLDHELHWNMAADDVQRLAKIVLDRARRIVPALKWAEVDSAVVGTRSIPGDGFPSIGWLPGLEGFYSMATHSGITLGPLLGRIAASEIMNNQVDSLLESFRPSRFVAPSVAQTVDT